MRGIVLSFTLLAMSIGAGQAAPTRSSSKPDWYIGGGYDRYTASGTNFDAGTVLGGWHFNRYVSVEVGGQFASVNGVSLTNLFADLEGHVPISRGLSLFGAIGGAYADESVSASISGSTITISQSGSGYRAGGGLDFWFTPHWGMRAGYFHQNAIGSADDLSLSIRYRF